MGQFYLAYFNQITITFVISELQLHGEPRWSITITAIASKRSQLNYTYNYSRAPYVVIHRLFYVYLHKPRSTKSPTLQTQRLTAGTWSLLTC